MMILTSSGVLAEEASKIASMYSDVISATILNVEQCKELKMGSYQGVAAAASEILLLSIMMIDKHISLWAPIGMIYGMERAIATWEVKQRKKRYGHPSSIGGELKGNGAVPISDVQVWHSSSAGFGGCKLADFYGFLMQLRMKFAAN
ncbi:hypothetical protein C3L33_02893, partial [Rhododendron williamsianum]